MTIETRSLARFEPVAFDPDMVARIESHASAQGHSTRRMPSGAAHDTQKLARIAPAGMVFVPSKEGRSHSAAEWTAWTDIEAGANVLLNTLYRLAS